MRFEVSTTIGRREAVIVPSSGIVTAKSDRNSSRNASNSSSARSISSISSTTGRSPSASSASSSGRRSRNRSENSSPSSTPPSAARSASSCRGVVPVVDGVVQVDPLVALQPDQASACGGRQRPGHLGLADPGLALEQQRLLEHDRQLDGQRQPADRPDSPRRRARRSPPRLTRTTHSSRAASRQPAASVSARRHSTRARWRL